MEKIATENLFLLEFVIDKVYIYPNTLPEEVTKVAADTCVSFSFLDNEPLDVCEEDFTPKLNYTDDQTSMRNGKSVLFSLTPAQAEEACVKFDVNVNVFQKLKSGVLPDKIQIGTSSVPIVELFNEMLLLLQAPEPPSTIGRTLKDSFKIMNENADVIGNLSVFIRISCYGKLIVTQFQMNLEEKSVFFKDKEGRSLYKYRKASKTDTNKPEATKEMKTCTKLIPSDTYMNFDGRCQECHYPSELDGYDSDMSSMDAYRQSSLDDKGCYQEIGAEMNGNALTIRVHKDKGTAKRLDAGESGSNYSSDMDKIENQSHSPCSCGKRERERPRKSKIDPCYCLKPPPRHPPCMEKQVLSLKPADDPSNPFAFKVSGCPNNTKNNVTVVSPTSTRADGMQMTEISDPDKDVFILRIGKKSEGNDKKSNLELELVTPKGIDRKPIPKKITRDTQYSESDAGPPTAGGKGKGKGKGKGGKGKKGAGASTTPSEDLNKKSTAETKVEERRTSKDQVKTGQKPREAKSERTSEKEMGDMRGKGGGDGVSKDTGKPGQRTAEKDADKSQNKAQKNMAAERAGKNNKSSGFGGGYIMPDLPPKKAAQEPKTVCKPCKCWHMSFSNDSISEKRNYRSPSTEYYSYKPEMRSCASTNSYCMPTVWKVPSYAELCCSFGKITSCQAYLNPQQVKCGYKS